MSSAAARPIVVAVGGNALVRRGGPDDVEAERRAAAAVAGALAPLVAAGRPLVIAHGNGPQVGALAEGAERAGRHVPLSVLVAQSQGHIGHLLQAALAVVADGRPVCCVLTHVLVDVGAGADAAPTKPVGAVVDQARADQLAGERGWTMRRDGQGWRRVVPSPEPHAIVELEAVRHLLAAGWAVIAGGGGGIPVVAGPGGTTPVDAVVDKDLTAALLAAAVDAEALVLLTDVDGVHRGWGSDRTELITRAAAADLRAERFEPGTMGPKVEGACRFAQATGRPARIGSLDDAAAVLAGRSGTRVDP